MKQTTDIALKDRIIITTRQLLLEEGYRNISLRKIARNIGVSATSIYLHFENKDDLIHTLMEQAIDRLNGRLQEAAETDTDPISMLESMARIYVNFALDNPQEYQIIFLFSSEELSRYPVEKFRKARRGYELVHSVLVEGVNQGLIYEEHPRLAAYTFWAQLHGVMSVVLSKRLDTRIDQKEFIEQAIEHIIHGYQLRTAVK